jgi:hypothetical protein
VTTSVVDHERDVKRHFVKMIVIQKGSGTEPPKTLFVSEPQEIGPETLLTRYSPSGKKRAVLKEYPAEENGGGKKKFVEVWDGERLEVIKDVTKFHEDFYIDGSRVLRFSSRNTDRAAVQMCSAHFRSRLPRMLSYGLLSGPRRRDLGMERRMKTIPSVTSSSTPLILGSRTRTKLAPRYSSSDGRKIPKTQSNIRKATSMNLISNLIVPLPGLDSVKPSSQRKICYMLRGTLTCRMGGTWV